MKSQTQNIMKQFDLDEYLKNPSKKVVTRDGRSVRIVCTDRVSEKGYPLLALVMTDGHECVYTYNRYGYFYTGDTNHELDLFFAPEKHEGWVNIYKAGVQKETLGCLHTHYVGSCIWPTEEEAKTAADPDPVATIKIEWEE